MAPKASATSAKDDLDQEKCLSDAVNTVKLQAAAMKRALDNNSLKEALKYSAQMLSELRTSVLSPPKYYELYVRVMDELRYLETFFAEENKRGKPCVELYELVQHAGNIVPRLYLLCTVGSVYIKSKEGPAKEILNDLCEILKGVQNPVRGLFLRAYLTQISRDKLPDQASDEQGEGGDVNDSISFLVTNFIEMNKLWVRMQHQGPLVGKDKREQERRQLRDLVGKNLHVLSQLDGVTLPIYKDNVLPRILEQVVNCKDDIAQQYLLECLIQVFPDEFHLNTLHALLDALTQLQPGVDVRAVMSQLMDRLADYAERTPQALPLFFSVNAFEVFKEAVEKVLLSQTDVALSSVVSLHSALVLFVLKIYAKEEEGRNGGKTNVKEEYLNIVMGSCASFLSSHRTSTKDSSTLSLLLSLLQSLLSHFNDINSLLALSHFSSLVVHLDRERHRAFGVEILRNILGNGTKLQSTEKVSLFFELLSVLVKEDGRLLPEEEELDPEDFAEEQHLVARVVQNLGNKTDHSEMLQTLRVAKDNFLTGGSRRMPFTIPPFVFASLQFALRLSSISPTSSFSSSTISKFESEEERTEEEGREGGKKPINDVTPSIVLEMLQAVLNALSDVNPELTLRLALQCAEVSSSVGLETMCYDFFTQSFLLYEEEIADSRVQVTCLHLLFNQLRRANVLGEESRETLSHKANGYASKLLRKADQCRAVYSCAHLFWMPEDEEEDEEEAREGAGEDERRRAETFDDDFERFRAHDTSALDKESKGHAGKVVRDGERVMSCLKRALKIATALQLQTQQRLGSTREGGGEGGGTAGGKGTASTVHVELLLEILNKSLYFFEQGVPPVTATFVQGLLDLVSAEVKSISPALSNPSRTSPSVSTTGEFPEGPPGPASDGGSFPPLVGNNSGGQGALNIHEGFSHLTLSSVHAFYRNTVAYIREQKERADSFGELYASVSSPP